MNNEESWISEGVHRKLSWELDEDDELETGYIFLIVAFLVFFVIAIIAVLCIRKTWKRRKRLREDLFLQLAANQNLASEAAASPQQHLQQQQIPSRGIPSPSSTTPVVPTAVVSPSAPDWVYHQQDQYNLNVPMPHDIAPPKPFDPPPPYSEVCGDPLPVQHPYVPNAVEDPQSRPVKAPL